MKRRRLTDSGKAVALAPVAPPIKQRHPAEQGTTRQKREKKEIVETALRERKGGEGGGGEREKSSENLPAVRGYLRNESKMAAVG